MATMAWRARDLSNGKVVLYAVHDSTPPNSTDFAEYIDVGRAVFRRIADPSLAVALTLTDGGAPSAEQRRQLVQAASEGTGGRVECIRSSVVSDSMFVRGVVTALGWFIRDMRMFPPTQVEQALDYIGVPPSDRAVVRDDLTELAEAVPRAKTVRSFISQIRVAGEAHER